MLVEPGAGDRISGRYVLPEAVGRGGMGVVWRARDEWLRRRVAVSYVVADEAEDGSCTVRTPHRTYADSAGEHTVEPFQLTVYGPLPEKTPCGGAGVLAGSVVGNIARQLPGE
ncbi:hypothetical protein ACIRBZ_00925 [Streptomyces sp. NPDC094038]|uniref:hypothetical protein n=1 Tax=Streptomyces sp. NPDC094038 TaxID=3366055 RepID=UPI0038151254